MCDRDPLPDTDCPPWVDSCRSRISNKIPENLNERKSICQYIYTLQRPLGRCSKSTILTHSRTRYALQKRTERRKDGFTRKRTRAYLSKLPRWLGARFRSRPRSASPDVGRVARQPVRLSTKWLGARSTSQTCNQPGTCGSAKIACRLKRTAIAIAALCAIQTHSEPHNPAAK